MAASAARPPSAAQGVPQAGAVEASKIPRRQLDRLVRGKLAPEARLDLHGMTHDEARRALIAFVVAAQARGLRLVLVITGKGRPDRSGALVPEREGVLRHHLPRWLATGPLAGRVLEMRPAHPRHGGTGASYLYLRRHARRGRGEGAVSRAPS